MKNCTKEFQSTFLNHSGSLLNEIELSVNFSLKKHSIIHTKSVFCFCLASPTQHLSATSKCSLSGSEEYGGGAYG